MIENTSKTELILNGIIKENPIFVMVLGLCPALAVTRTFDSALGMGLSLLFVLIFSNLIISALRNIVPKEIRIPVYIVIISTLASVVQILLGAYLPALNEKLGVFISLIAVNCIISARAESFASHNNPFKSIFDAIGMGIGFTLAILGIALVREILGSGTLTIWSSASIETARSIANQSGGFLVLDAGIKFDFNMVYNFFKVKPAEFFVSSAGAFVVLAGFIGIINIFKNKKGAQ